MGIRTCILVAILMFTSVALPAQDFGTSGSGDSLQMRSDDSITAYRNSNCATVLDRAARSYEQGNFHEMQMIISSCLNDGMSAEEQWQGYRLLALSYIFLDDPAGADSAIQSMLAINPRYEPSPGRDPIELIRPLQAYGSHARFLAGVKVGGNLSDRSITRRYSVVGTNYTVDHQLGLGSDLGVFAQFNISPNIALATELLLSSRTAGYTADGLLGFHTEYTEQLSYLNTPLLVHYSIGSGPLRPFVYAGYFAQWLLSATSDLSAIREGETDTSGEVGTKPVAFDDNGLRTTEDRRRSLNHGIAAGLGLMYSLGPGALIIDARYEHGLAPVVDSGLRFSNSSTLYKYFYLDDDFMLRNFSVSLGYALQLSFTTYRK